MIERLSAALEGRYRVERELGKGGMATVYLAHDMRHDREVAIKVLHPDLGAALGGERFLSEIKTTARLQHPHILPLLDSGDADGLLFYVMPYVSGETLRARLEREAQLPIADAVRIARETADALSAAHALGIIHRDIKPENILLQGGHALVADFGVALAVQSAGGPRMTQTGLSVGTPQYMSPEQAMGERSVDARADVYSLGTVTYEMLAGDPPFTGSTVQAIIAKLMSDPPRPLTELRRSVPENVAAAVFAALEKLPADRIASAAAFSHALGDEAFLGAGATVGDKTRKRAAPSVPLRWLLVALAFNAAMGAAAFLLWLRAPAPQGMSRQHVELWQHPIPEILAPGARFVGTQAAIAPDGSSIVFSDSSAAGFMLMRKLREAGEATPLAGTEGAVSPFFSPDGKWIGYLTMDNRLRKVPVTGGGSVTLAQNTAPGHKSGAWLDDGTIVYVDRRTALPRIPEDGGNGSRVTLREHVGQPASLWPLPGSRGVLFTSCAGNCSTASSVYVYDFAADSARLLVPGATGVWYSPTGHLLYTSRDGGLYATAFDARRLELRSGAVPILEGVRPGSFTLSASGAVLYTTGASAGTPSRLMWVSRDGVAEPLDSTWEGHFEYPALSPDGNALAVSLRDRTTDLWIRSADGTRQKIIAAGVANWRASWLADGQSLVFTSVGDPDNPNDAAVYKVRTDGGGKAELLLRDRFGVWEAEVSRDGQWLVVRLDEEGTNSNVRKRHLTGDTALTPVLTGPHNELSPTLSPDGRWLAYTSNETGGHYEVYVASFPDVASKRLASTGGGTEPRWARNGRELFFVSGGRLMAVKVASPGFNLGTPHPLFSVAGYRRARNRPQFDVGPDGRFVMIHESAETAEAMYVEGWFSELVGKMKR